jgi:pimeloyl-ACP methyl ester carboxylesterase
MPPLADARLAVLVPDMRGYGDSDQPTGTIGQDGRAVAEEFRSNSSLTTSQEGSP